MTLIPPPSKPRIDSEPPSLTRRHTPPFMALPGDKTTRVAGRIATRLLALIAAGVIVVWTKPVLLPLVFAFLMAMLLLPLVGWMRRRGVPAGLAVVLAQLVGTLPILLLGFVFFVSAEALTRELPKYQASLTNKLNATVDATLDRMLEYGPQTGVEYRDKIKDQLTEKVLPEVVGEGVGFAQSSLAAATATLGYFFLIALMTIFILLEGQRFREKIVEAYGGGNALLNSLEAIGRDVRTYVVAKSAISGFTGFCVWLFLEVTGVDFAGFWGLLAFPLNFIPTVGAIAASLPPILVALVDPEMGPWAITGVTVGLLAVNGIIGSWLDPRYVGHSLQLSPLVVFLSMLVWALLWGPVGMLLSVPIMVSIKVICSHVEGLEPVAELMKA